MSTFLFWWLVCGVGFLPLLMVMEGVATLVKGPEYALWLRKHMTEPRRKLSTLALVVGWIILWPFFFVTWVRAGWNRMTFMEWTIRKKLARDEEKTRLRTQANTQARQLVEALGTSQGTLWMSPFIKGVPFIVYARVEGVGAALICTHLVIMIPPERRIGVVRIGAEMAGPPPDPDTSAPDAQFGIDALPAALAWCNHDDRWNQLCRTGTEHQRMLFQKGMLR